ncbi:MAG: DUF2076 domain-containing protein [Xanthobacteraceae bacterium]
MTPQERALVTELFDRLSTLENTRRDPDAERLIADGVRRAPNAIYGLVQTVLLQDEALKQAEARLRDAGATGTKGGFLDSMRNEGDARGSVPTIPQQSKWNSGRVLGPAVSTPQPVPSYAQSAGGPGSSFLGTAAAAAVGAIGGNLLFSGLRNMMGGGQASAFGSPFENAAERQGPWPDASHGDLARDAGLGDVTGGSGGSTGGGRSAGLFDNGTSNDDQQLADNDDAGFDDSDFGDTGSSDA